eukprot:m.1478935 g.1478935  ORF g.1478935 m.1478935 type:complete len:377 (-) comp25166_c0_seq4:4980-6110(-)
MPEGRIIVIVVIAVFFGLALVFDPIRRSISNLGFPTPTTLIDTNRSSAPKISDKWLNETLDPEQKKWRLMILFQHNLPMLEQAVASYRRASKIMAPRIIVIDNSLNKAASRSSRLVKSVVQEIIDTPRLLNFPELHNFMANIAVSRRFEFFFWAHADDYVLPITADGDLGVDVLTCMYEQISAVPNWGLLLFAYDHLAAYRTQTMAQVPWDPNVFQYGSDCDVYGRIRDSGYIIINGCGGNAHISYDMNSIVNITDSTSYEDSKVILKASVEAVNVDNRNSWRDNVMEPKEQQWRSSMLDTSSGYLKRKWNQDGCKLGGVPCHANWPYCPQCPPHVPDCTDKSVSWERIEYIHAESRKIFAADRAKIISYEDFVPK